MEKVRRKITILRVLQVVFYALGFPLFVHLVMLANKPIADSYLAGNMTAYMAIIIAAVLWVVVILIQLLFKAICRKNRMARAVWVALFAAVITLAPVLYSDFMLKGEYDAIVDKYVEEGLSESKFYNYEKAITPEVFEESLANLNAEIKNYVAVYNLDMDALTGNNFGNNGDGSEVTYDEEAQAYYSPNGMFSDGYLFSLKQAIAVQRAYYENKLAYEAEGKDIDAELAAALLALENDKSSDWNKYKSGASASSFDKEGFEYIASEDEYELAYGEDGYAKKFYVTDDRLDAIASVIGGKLGANPDVGSLLSIIDMLPIELPEGLDINSLLTEDLTVDQLIDVINGLGLGKTLAGLMGSDAENITKDDLMNLLSGYSNYQSPSTYPIFYFLEDEALQEYAYANYYATIHGGKVGSVLVGENVGLMNLDNMAGTPNPYSTQGLLDMFDYWDAQTEIINNIYPMIAVRNTALKMSASIVFCILAAYWFTSKIDEQYAKLKLAKK
ncbi:MAG: hypothetical protein IJ033_01975 [Clostridia bacterium]|nr:hypothetical protein [Clostridia bacterium]